GAVRLRAGAHQRGLLRRRGVGGAAHRGGIHRPRPDRGSDAERLLPVPSRRGGTIKWEEPRESTTVLAWHRWRGPRRTVLELPRWLRTGAGGRGPPTAGHLLHTQRLPHEPLVPRGRGRAHRRERARRQDPRGARSPRLEAALPPRPGPLPRLFSGPNDRSPRPGDGI